jgi:hypothetical protein
MSHKQIGGTIEINKNANLLLLSAELALINKEIYY